MERCSRAACIEWRRRRPEDPSLLPLACPCPRPRAPPCAHQLPALRLALLGELVHDGQADAPHHAQGRPQEQLGADQVEPLDAHSHHAHPATAVGPEEEEEGEEWDREWEREEEREACEAGDGGVQPGGVWPPAVWAGAGQCARAAHRPAGTHATAALAMVDSWMLLAALRAASSSRSSLTLAVDMRLLSSEASSAAERGRAGSAGQRRGERRGLAAGLACARARQACLAGARRAWQGCHDAAAQRGGLRLAAGRWTSTPLPAGTLAARGRSGGAPAPPSPAWPAAVAPASAAASCRSTQQPVRQAAKRCWRTRPSLAHREAQVAVAGAAGAAIGTPRALLAALWRCTRQAQLRCSTSSSPAVLPAAAASVSSPAMSQVRAQTPALP